MTYAIHSDTIGHICGYPVPADTMNLKKKKKNFACYGKNIGCSFKYLVYCFCMNRSLENYLKESGTCTYSVQ